MVGQVLFFFFLSLKEGRGVFKGLLFRCTRKREGEGGRERMTEGEGEGKGEGGGGQGGANVEETLGKSAPAINMCLKKKIKKQMRSIRSTPAVGGLGGVGGGGACARGLMTPAAAGGFLSAGGQKGGTEEGPGAEADAQAAAYVEALLGVDGVGGHRAACVLAVDGDPVSISLALLPPLSLSLYRSLSFSLSLSLSLSLYLARSPSLSLSLSLSISRSLARAHTLTHSSPSAQSLRLFVSCVCCVCVCVCACVRACVLCVCLFGWLRDCAVGSTLLSRFTRAPACMHKRQLLRECVCACACLCVCVRAQGTDRGECVGSVCACRMGL